MRLGVLLFASRNDRAKRKSDEIWIFWASCGCTKRKRCGILLATEKCRSSSSALPRQQVPVGRAEERTEYEQEKDET